MLYNKSVLAQLQNLNSSRTEFLLIGLKKNFPKIGLHKLNFSPNATHITENKEKLKKKTGLFFSEETVRVN